MNKYNYKGTIITASSKKEAIQKIIAGSTNHKIDMKVVNKWMKKNLDVTDKGLNKDHWEINGEIYYTLKAAKRIAKKVSGYHLPTLNEWHKLAEACGCSLIDEEGKFKTFKKGNIVNLLKIKNTGYCYETLSGKQNVIESNGYFWTSENGGCCAYVDSGTFETGYFDDKTGGLTVRLVKD
jgi:uncharacterized protein (TIGR02145 family)